MIVPASNSTFGADRSGFAPRLSTFSVTVAPFVRCGVNAIIWPLRWADVSKTEKLLKVYAVDVPAVMIAPAMSSRYFAVAAIMARAESLMERRLALLPVDRAVRGRVG
jgi:hypothetical protein